MVDCVEEAGMDSFPASDPPSFTPFGGSAVSPSLRTPTWLRNVDRSRLPVSGTMHAFLLSAIEDLNSAQKISVEPAETLMDLLLTTSWVLKKHREAMLGDDDLGEDIESNSQWLLPRLGRIITRHEQLEELIAEIVGKLEAWPPSGSEGLSWQIVSGELQIAAALLTQVLMEEHFLEHAIFDPPPAHD